MTPIEATRLSIESASYILNMTPEQVCLLIPDAAETGEVTLRKVFDAVVVLCWPRLLDPARDDPFYREMAAIVAAHRAASGLPN